MIWLLIFATTATAAYAVIKAANGKSGRPIRENKMTQIISSARQTVQR